MASNKKYFFRFINNFSGIIPADILNAVTGKKCLPVFYHAVSDKVEPHIRHLYPVRSSEKFSNDLDFLLKKFSPVTLEKFLDIHQNGEKKKQNTFFLSFDDGLSPVMDVVAPLLAKKGIPAHIFINPSFIDNKDLMFRYRQSLIIDKLIHSSDDQAEKKIADLLCESGIHFRNVKEGILDVKYHQKEILDKFADILECDFNEFLKNHKPYLSTEQIKELIKMGFTVGAHSLDHPDFRYIPFEEQIFQIKESVDYITNNFNQKIKSFAFPFTDFGLRKELFEYIDEQLLVDCTFGGAGLKNERLKKHFQRIPMEETTLSGKKIIKSEYLYYLVKGPFGKNTIKRN